MQSNILHTPEGFRDLYNGECEKKKTLEKDLLQAMKQYGYQEIQTPTIEYAEVFDRKVGTTSEKELFRFFDRDGSMLVLRPDITPSIARCVSTYFKENVLPTKLCYVGNTFINNHNYQGRLKEVTQIGAELINDATIDGDAEILAMVIHCMKKAGLTEFIVSVGHALFLN